jgi:sugar/nucleoside kinase (ribokinase family)
VGDGILAGLEAAGVGCDCVRVDGGVSPVSAILVDPQGGRTIVHHRDPALGMAQADDPERLVADIDGVLADDHYPEFVAPICAAARRRGLPVVLDVEKARSAGGPLWIAATHRIFSRGGLTATTGSGDLAAGLARLAAGVEAFHAVTDGASPVCWRAGESAGKMPVFPVDAVDTLAAGDVFHGAFALALLEAGDSVGALRFAAAAAALKCRRFGGGAATPTRAEVDRFLSDIDAVRAL